MNLPVPAVGSATAVEPASAVEATTCRSVANRAAAESAANWPSRAYRSVHCRPASECSYRSSDESTASTESTAPFKARPSIEAPATEARASVEAVIPRTGADKDSAREPLRTVVAVWRTRVRVIRVVTVSARGSGAKVSRANSNSYRAYAYANANRNSLRIGERRHHHERPNKSENS